MELLLTRIEQLGEIDFKPVSCRLIVKAGLVGSNARAASAADG